MPKLVSLDHLVLTVANIDVSIAFYCDVLGMEAMQFLPLAGGPRWALSFGHQKINLHPAAAPFEPKAAQATPGSADLCFLTETPLAEWQAHLLALDVAILEGPVARTGATGPIVSIYIRDPDENLVEIGIPST